MVNEELNRNINIVIFDDSELENVQLIDRKLEFPRSVYSEGLKYSITWHKEWNAHEDFSGAVSISSDDEFAKALNWCRSFTGVAICFFDYQLLGVTIADNQVEEAGNLALKISSKKNVRDATKFFNNDNHGLLLAIVLAQNTSSNTDIWFSTSQVALSTTRTHLEILQCAVAPHRVVNSTGNALTKSPVTVVVDSINDSIDT